MLEHMPRALLIAIVAVALFGSLVGARYIFVPGERGALKPDYAYNMLGVALSQTGLGPTLATAQAEAAFRAVAQNPDRVQRGTDAGGAPVLAVSSVLVCRLEGDFIAEATLYPQQWRMLRSGPLRQALYDVGRLSLARQAGRDKGEGGIPVAAQNFEFAATAGGQSYTFIPHFDGQRCLDIVVRFGMPQAAPAAAPAVPGAAGQLSVDDANDLKQHGLNPDTALDAL
jgi:hypothetical protein